MNRLERELARVCRERLLDEKWLVAPSRRVGYQWLESVTRSGQAVLNVRVKTMAGMALELAGPRMAAQGLEWAPRARCVLIIDKIWEKLCENNTIKYLRASRGGLLLLEMLYNAINSLRLAGLGPDKLNPGQFEANEKGEELLAIMQEYLNALKSSGLVDYPDVLNMAAAMKEEDPIADNVLVLVPEDADFRLLELNLLDCIPPEKRISLPVDQPCAGVDSREKPADAAFLRWRPEPPHAPAASNEGTASIFHAVGEVNEVREVFRRCLAKGYSLDEVEIVHTDAETYVPLIYETAMRLPVGGNGTEELPVTFAEGIPARYSRSGRALTAWIDWIRGDYPQTAVVRMIQDGLVEIGPADNQFTSFEFANLLRNLGIGWGRERYLEKLDEHIASLEARARLGVPIGEDDEPDSGDMSNTRRSIKGLGLLRDFIGRLLDVSPLPQSPWGEVLEGAARFIEMFARSVNEMDNYAEHALLRDIRRMAEWMRKDDIGGSGIDIWDWLSSLPAEITVLGSRPRPGCVHVSGIYSGGHSGRRHTFIVGLDESRFPGAALQDPLILDSERNNLSPHLPASGKELDKKMENFARLLARLRGTVTLSFSCRDIADDRELSPSRVVLSAYRILSNNRNAQLSEFLAWLRAPNSFAPDGPDKCADMLEWWLWRLTGTAEIAEPEKLVARYFPHLGRGYTAEKERAGINFTVYDGWVPDAATDADPTAPGGPVMSVSRLEKLGQCPLGYFFRYILGIKLPEELTVDNTRWLDALNQGSLLHKVFHRFMSEMIKDGKKPEFERDEKRIVEILDEEVALLEERFPKPNENTYRAQYREMAEMVKVFLREQEGFFREGKPMFLEAAIGMEEGDISTEMDTEKPEFIFLPGLGKMRVRGRVDRVDRIGPESACKFKIWDYKTGGTFKYDQPKGPFQQGRVLQPALYIMMVAARLKKRISPEAGVEGFGYFFPGAAGLRKIYGNEEQKKFLDDACGVLVRLCKLLRAGAFVATDTEEDCNICDYRCICGESEEITRHSKLKIENEDNDIIEPFRELRSSGGKSRK